jgi:hypothetical protein
MLQVVGRMIARKRSSLANGEALLAIRTVLSVIFARGLLQRLFLGTRNFPRTLCIFR